MSLKNFEELSSRHSFDNILFKPKSQRNYLPSIEQKTPKALILKSTSTILSMSDKNDDDLKKYMKNPEVFYKEINQRLAIQKKEIDKRNELITNLQKNFDEIRVNFLREKNENLEKTRQIQILKQNILLLESQNPSSKKTDNLLNFENENTALKTKIKEMDCSFNKKLEETAENMNKYEKEIEVLRKDLELTRIHNNELENLVRSGSEKIHLLKMEIQQRREEIKELNEIIRIEKNSEGDLKQKFEEQAQEIDSLKKDFAQRLLKKEEEIQRLKSEQLDLNYKIRRKEIEFIEMKKTLQSAKENELKIASLNEELQQEQRQSENLKKQLESLRVENASLKDLFKNEKNEKIKNIELQITKNFKNVNEEIKNLKNKIDYKIEKHITHKNSEMTNNEEKIKNLSQINKNLTSFIIILQNRLKNSKNANEEGEVPKTAIEENIMKNLSCCKCHLLLAKPVTCIPCGHSYCQDCKSGYSSFCLECGKSNGDIDAVYRNVLMDEMIVMVRSLSLNPNSKNLKNFL